MESLIADFNIVEPINNLIKCWKDFNINHNMALDKNEELSSRVVSAELTESNMEERYRLIGVIDDLMEIKHGQI